MVTRRTDARRRRVLSEEFVPTDQEAVAGSKKPMQAYSYGANRRNQPKTTDLIPKRGRALGLFFAFVVTGIAALNALAFNAASLVDFVGEDAAGSFALSGPGTLANWVCCVSLFLSSGLCMQLFLLRKHKRDDYGGMYRVWVLMAIIFLLASVHCAVDLRSVAAKVFELATHRSLLDPPWLMLTIESIVLAVFVIRLLFEVRASRVSLATVLLVWIGFVGCIVLRNAKLPEDISWFDQQVAYGNCVLIGCVGSLVTLTVYARFVFLHAHGLIQMKVSADVDSRSESEDSEASPRRSILKRVFRQKTNVESEHAEPEPATSIKFEASRTTRATKTTTKAAKPAPQKAKVAPQPAKPVAQPVKTTPQPAKPARTKVAKRKKAAEPAPAPAPPQKAPTPVVTRQKPIVKQAAQPAQTTKKAPKVVSADSQSDELQQELENIDTVPMSKSERRRQRKLAKRAAREKKAA